MNSLQITLCAVVCGVLGCGVALLAAVFWITRVRLEGQQSTLYSATPVPPRLASEGYPFYSARALPELPRKAPEIPATPPMEKTCKWSHTFPEGALDKHDPPRAPEKFWERYHKETMAEAKRNSKKK